VGKVCPKCNGVGSVKVSPDLWRRCQCSWARVFTSRVGAEIATSLSVRESPLYELGDPPGVDLTRSNLILKGWWSDIVPHLKFALYFKNVEYDLHYYMRIVTDERLLQVWFGNEGYKSKDRKTREEVPTFNSLQDLVGSDQNLVIIRLGFLGYKNAAAPGIFKEALMIRQAAALPTWIVETPDSIFGVGHRAYSEDVADYIRPRFQAINLTVDRDRPIVPRGVDGAGLEEDEGMAVDEHQRTVVMPLEQFPAPRQGFDPGLAMGSSKYKGRKGKRNTKDDIA